MKGGSVAEVSKLATKYIRTMEKEFLIKKDDKVIPDIKNEIRLFMVIRNEVIRLPYFYKYYRELGVDRFFVIDNASSDLTAQYLSKQPDTHVFYTEGQFRNKEFWLKEIMDQYGVGYWCLVVDADEIFIYPYCERVNLRLLCNFLDKEGKSTIENLLVDMYPKGRIEESIYKMGDSLMKHSPYFDPYCYERSSCMRRHIMLGSKKFMTAYFGGTRKRLFGIENLCCSKYSLIRYSQDVLLDAGMHFVVGASASSIQGVVLHFKFLHDFCQRVHEEVKREEHFNKAKEYKKYQEKIISGEFGVIYHNNSIHYIDTLQMLDLGFMKSSDDFNTYLREADIGL